MSRIRVLPDDVANQIAAGEVIERPASIVKELIENAIDARSKRISVDVDGGGRQLIRVTDDGDGIIAADAQLCFLRHSTSKLRTADELSSINTLGFRGEALPSIGSVSRVLLETQTREAPTGVRLQFEGGHLISCKEGAFPPGTQITVEDVFYKVPARRKFLKSESSELGQITTHSTHYSLAFPGIHFTLKSGKFEVLSTPPAANARERIFQVFGGDLLDELVEYRQDYGSSGMKVHLFTSRPHVQKYNRNSMFFFVNGRAVRDRIILHACNEAYRTILPTGTFPVIILFIEVRPKDVDVNVHPAKTEVRFQYGSMVHDAVRNTVLEALKSDKTIVPMGSSSETGYSSRHEVPAFQSRVPESWKNGPLAKEPLTDMPGRVTFPDSRSLELNFPVQQYGEQSDLGKSGLPDFKLIQAEIRPLGQLQDSFIVAVDSSGLILIDQHVAHERILFEQYVKGRMESKIEVQQLLVPILLELSPTQEVVFEAIGQELLRNGFEVEPFGVRTIAVKTAPGILKAGAVEKLLRELVDGLEAERKELDIDSFRQKIAATVSCHAAIKINNPLDSVKMRWLVTELMKTDCPTVCPHGRPIILRYDLREIQKAFKRL